MLLLGTKLNRVAVISLQTGTRLAVTKSAIIDPSNLKIIAYEIDGAMISHNPSFILTSDIRELSNIGIIIDSSDEFIHKNDVVKLDKLCETNFNIQGLTVLDEHKHKLGKIQNYSVDINSFIIQQINVKQNLLKRINETELLIHRNQIIEINNQAIIVKSAAKKLESIDQIKKNSYLNPFRSTSTPA